MALNGFVSLSALGGQGWRDDSDPSDLDSLDDGAYDWEDDVTLDSIKKSHTIHFPIRSTYTKWGPVEAFRELVQNWRDGIIKSFNIRENEFLVIREERTKSRNTEIVYKVLRPGAEPKEWLGYILFTARDGMGSIDIVNRRATLQPWHLDMGGTSKADDSHQAGAHGEGLKVALLVLQRGRQNHCVRCVTGSFTWNFNFTNRGRLVARLRRMMPEQLVRIREKSRQTSEKSLAPFAPEPDRDVQFRVGQRASGRDQYGDKTKRDPVSLEQFNRWCETALFLQDVEDGGIVLSDRGDLITDPRLCGNIYLKGLLLKRSSESTSASMTGKPLKYGYNFQDGTTNRERQSVGETMEETRAILSIWNKVLLVRPTYVRHLSDMLNSSDPEYADVSMAKSLMRIETAVRLKEYLFSDSTNWYYSVGEKKENPRLERIIQGLGCKGVELQDAYWSVLETHNFIRTAEQEQERHFLAAESVSVPQTSFAQGIRRLIRACLHGCHYTEGMQVQFVKAGQLSLHTFYLETEQQFRIHEKWLNKDAAIQELGLLEDLAETDVLFHSVKRLFSDALYEVPTDKFETDEDHPSDWHRTRELSRVEQRLLDYIRIKENMSLVTFFDNPNELLVRETRGVADSQMAIQLHRVTRCSHLADLLIAEDVSREALGCIEIIDAPERAEMDEYQRMEEGCTCFASFGQRCFCGFKGGEEYFAIVFRPSDPGSIVFVSNTCVAPKAPPPPPPPPAAPKLPVKKRLCSVATSRKSPYYGIIRAPGNRSQVAHNSPSSRPANGIENEEAARPLPSADSSPPPPPSSPLPARSPSPAPNNEARMNGDSKEDSTRQSYTVGDPIRSLDILTPRDWFEAENRPAGAVVIGLLKDRAEGETSRKRRRT